MQFPSINNVAQQAGKSLKRFQIPLLYAFAGTILCIMKLENTSFDEDLLAKMIHTALLSLPFSLGCMLYAERNGNQQLGLLYLAAFTFSGLYFFFYAPDASFSDVKATLTFFVLNIVMHLWVAVSAYTRKDERYGFWRFNEALFVRMIISGIFSAVLFAGLALALFAIDNLFKVKINETAYGDTWLVIAGVFNTWFFLSGIPEDYAMLNKEKIFPKGLKIFTQYILIPLATLYMVILYAYAAKIIIQWSLPKGWVSMLIVCYSIVGILSILLVYPLRDDANNAWVRFFTRFFFIALLPLIVLLYTAIGVRINQYGITELRYYLLLLGAWLTLMALYYIFSKQKNIKVIPATLAVFSLLTLFGPWSVFNVSQRSQAHRLEKLLVKNGIWATGKPLTAPKKEVPQKDAKEIRNIVDYFVDMNEVPRLQRFYTVNLEALISSIHKKQSARGKDMNRWDEKNDLNDTLVAMLYVSHDIRASRATTTLFNMVQNAGTDIKGYDIMHHYVFNSYDAGIRKIIHVSDKDSLLIKMANTGDSVALAIYRGDALQSEINIMPLIRSLQQANESDDIPAATMTLYGQGTQKAKLVIEQLSINDEDDDEMLYHMDAWLLMDDASD